MKRIVLIATIIMYFTLYLSAQLTVSGIITGKYDTPLSEVIIQVKNTDFKTISNDNGSYNMIIPELYNTLNFIKKGYKTKEVEIIGEEVNVKLTLEVMDIFDLTLGELLELEVVTSSKRGENINLTPNVMHVISKEQIMTRGYMNLRDVLSDVPGINISFNSLQFVSQVRGIAPNDNEKVGLLINSIFISQVTEDNYLTDLINLNDVERIEIIIGPGSVLYGSQSLTAMINIITKKIDNTEITLSGGSAMYNSITASTGKQFNDASFFLSFSRVQTDGWDAWRNSSSDFENLKNTTYTGQLYPSYLILGNFNYNNWSMQFNSVSSSMPELYIHNGGQDVAGNRDDYQNVLSINNTKEWTRNLSTVFEASYNNNRMLRAVTENENTFGVQSSFDLSQERYGMNYSLIYNNDKHYFQTGIQLNNSQNNHNYMFTWQPNSATDSATTMQSLVEIKDNNSIGFYLSENYKITNKLDITLASRFDYNTILSYKKMFFSPRVALVYNPIDIITLKAMYNRALRMPSPWMSQRNELWNVNKIDTTGTWLQNTMAENPERLSAYEFQIIFNFKKARFSVNAYYQQLQDFIAWYSPFTNVGDFKGKGLELTTTSILSENINIWGNANYNDATFMEYNQSSIEYGIFKIVGDEQGEVMSVPKITGTLGLDFKFGNIYFSPRVTHLYDIKAFDGNTNEIINIENRTYLNATLTWNNIFKKNINLQLIGKNLTNNTDILPMQFQAMTYNPQGITSYVRIQFNF